MSRFRLTCPVCCGGVITPWGRTTEGNHRGYCASCYHRVTITVNADDVGVGLINRDAPFFPLVKLVDAFSTQIARPSPGGPQPETETIDA